MWVSALAWPRAKAALASLGLSFQAIRQWPCAALSGSGAAQSGRPRSKPMDSAWALSSAWPASQRQARAAPGPMPAISVGAPSSLAAAALRRLCWAAQSPAGSSNWTRRASPFWARASSSSGDQLLVGRQGEEYAALGLVDGDGDGQAAAVGQLRLFDVRLVRLLLLPEQQAGAEQRDEGERHDVAPFRFAHGAVFLNVGPDR